MHARVVSAFYRFHLVRVCKEGSKCVYLNEKSKSLQVDLNERS